MAAVSVLAASDVQFTPLEQPEVFDDLLARHGFRDIGPFELAPATHAVTYGPT